MTIPTITPLPQAPQVTDAPSVFSQRANTFVAALGQLVTETNATTAEINQALAGALVLFDAYEGDWEAGSYAEGDVVRKEGVFYISLTDSNTQEPPDSNWQELLTAAQTSFDPSASGLSASNVQAAIDEVQGGLGTMAEQDANNVTITGGSIGGSVTGVTKPTATSDTTLATTAFVQAVAAGTEQPLGTMAEQNANNVNITGGSISGVSMPASVITSGTFNTARIPGLPATQITSGTFPSARLSGGYTNVNQIAGLVSAAFNTGLVSNTHRRTVISSFSSISNGIDSTVLASSDSTSGNTNCAVIAARRVLNQTTQSLAMGNAFSGGASSANRTIHLLGSSGNVEIAGNLTSNASFSDFAEMMPNGTGAEIPAGTILTLDDGEVRPANDGEDICGVVSHTGAVLAGDTPFCWQGRYLCDEFGRRIYETIPDPDWEPGEGQTEAYRPDITVLKENPEWNPDLPQVPRSERPDEWTPVGIIGQVYVRTGEAVQSGDKIKPVAGVGFKSTERTGLRVMTVTKEYDGDYGIARCMLNVIV